jgi:hypothetical protein
MYFFYDYLIIKVNFSGILESFSYVDQPFDGLQPIEADLPYWEKV